MKTIYGKVSCEYWNQSRDIEAEVEDDATPEQIEAALRDVAIERSGFEFWRTDGPVADDPSLDDADDWSGDDMMGASG